MNSQVKTGLLIASGLVVALPLGLAVSSWSRSASGSAPAAASNPSSKERQAAFPTAELAMLDRDVQERFAVVPQKDFGMSRISVRGHNIYRPATKTEQQTIAALQEKGVNVAFYVMSRRMWLSKTPVEQESSVIGPVRMVYAKTPPAAQSQKRSATVSQQPVTRRPGDGFKELRVIGGQVFRMVEAQPEKAASATRTLESGWKVVAVPVPASAEACVSCHNGSTVESHQKIKLGDAVGVAFYAYK
ncbi:MAG TPA: hypothetical protein VF627_13380 [Abditibacterium sp.]|jgi:hypothetical protein